MAVTNTTRRVYATPNGVTTVFQGPKVYEASHLKVYSFATGEPVLVPSSDYTVTGLGATPSTVTFAIAPAASLVELLLLRVIPFLQSTRFTNQGAFLPELHEKVADMAVMRDQEMDERLDRALRLSDLTDLGGISMELPSPEANKGLFWNATGSAIVNATVEGTGDMSLRGDLAATTGAALVGIVRPEAGAVPRVTSAKLLESLSVADFGADPTGVADATAAINAALATGHALIDMGKGEFLTSSPLLLKTSQTLAGLPIGTHQESYADHAIIKFRPATGVGVRNVAIKADTAVYGEGQNLRDIVLDLNDAAHMGVQMAGCYSNSIEGLAFKAGSVFDIGLLISASYVCDVDRFINVGCSVKRYGILVGQTNALTIRKAHFGALPQAAGTCMTGIAIHGGASTANVSLRDITMQGATIGVDIGGNAIKSVSIDELYNENVLCNLRIGTSANGPGGINIRGGTFGEAYGSHPQYASRGPNIYVRGGNGIVIQGARFDSTPDFASATGPWPIVCGDFCTTIMLLPCSIFGAKVLRELVGRENAGTNPSLTCMGGEGTYANYGETEIVLKREGTYGGNCARMHVNNAGAWVYTAFQPPQIPAAVNALLTAAMPVPSTLVL